MSKVIIGYFKKGTKVIYQERLKDKIYYGLRMVETPINATVYRDVAIRDSYNDTMDHHLDLLFENGVIAMGNIIEGVEKIDEDVYEIDTGIMISTVKIIR